MNLNVILHALQRYGRKRQILDSLDIKDPVDLDPFKKSWRLRVFNKKGCSCVSCKKAGTILIKSLDKGGGAHWDLFAQDGTMLTVDHILPKSKGGKNNLENLQPMCYDCNTEKGDKYANSDATNAQGQPTGS